MTKKISTHIGIGKIKNAARISESPRHMLQDRYSILDEKDAVDFLAQNFSENIDDKNKSTTQDPSDEGEGQLSIDVYQNDLEITIISAIAGVLKTELQITITDETLTIKGERRMPIDLKNQQAINQECFWGKFTRHIVLPNNVNPEGIKAVWKKNILIITIPKTNTNKPKIIKIT